MIEEKEPKCEDDCETEILTWMGGSARFPLSPASSTQQRLFHLCSSSLKANSMTFRPNQFDISATIKKCTKHIYPKFCCAKHFSSNQVAASGFQLPLQIGSYAGHFHPDLHELPMHRHTIAASIGGLVMQNLTKVKQCSKCTTPPGLNLKVKTHLVISLGF